MDGQELAKQTLDQIPHPSANAKRIVGLVKESGRITGYRLFFTGSHGIPELVSITLVVILHLWKRQMLVSIAGGTVCYMLLVQFIF